MSDALCALFEPTPGGERSLIMCPRIFRGTLLIFIIAVFTAPSAEATWPIYGKAICTAAYHQLDPKLVSDGAGGAIITWYDNRSGTNIYAQRVDEDGHILWIYDGELVCGAPASQYYPEIAADGSGGAIICWEDYRTSLNFRDIYAQKVNASGVDQWAGNGAEVCVRADTQAGAKVVSDGAGGGIFVWRDERDNNQDLYAQRIDTGGNRRWAAGGVLICTDSTEEYGHQIIADGAGGAIITWYGTREGADDHDVFAQRIDSSGVVQWTADGATVSSHPGAQLNPQLVSDESGGAIIVLEYENADIFAQRISAGGTLMWDVNDVPICTVEGGSDNPQIDADGFGGAVITWEDNRTGSDGMNIFAQRVNASGDTLWSADGIPVCTSSGTQSSPRIAGDGFGGAIVSWENEVIHLADHDIYARIIDASGNAQGIGSGILISMTPEMQNQHVITADGNGGAILTWRDSRAAGWADIYAAKLTGAGYTGIGTPGLRDAGALAQNFPNPFNPSTTIQFALPDKQHVTLTVYSVQGRRIATLINESKEAGPHEVKWSGRDDDGRLMPSGVYFYRLEAGAINETRHMVLIK